MISGTAFHWQLAFISGRHYGRTRRGGHFLRPSLLCPIRGNSAFLFWPAGGKEHSRARIRMGAGLENNYRIKVKSRIKSF